MAEVFLDNLFNLVVPQLNDRVDMAKVFLEGRHKMPKAVLRP